LSTDGCLRAARSRDTHNAVKPKFVHDWLLEPSNPSVRFRTLTELLGESPRSTAVREARAALVSSPAVSRILERMHPGGYWLQKNSAGVAVGDGVEYGNFATTHFCLASLAELGMDRTDPSVAKAGDRYLGLQSADGDFWRHMSCLNGYNIRTFVMLGFGDDTRLRKTISLMQATGRADGGYLCEIHEGKRKKRPVRSCARGSAKALMAFSALPTLWRSARCVALVDYFLGRGGIYRNDDPSRPVTRESSLTVFPFTWGAGLIDILYGLATMGHGMQPQLDRAWSMLESKRDSQGKYRLDWTATQSLLKAGKRGEPNKWITLYSLLALQRRARGMRG
jgi:hypothetical protein